MSWCVRSRSAVISDCISSHVAHIFHAVLLNNTTSGTFMTVQTLRQKLKPRFLQRSLSLSLSFPLNLNTSLHFTKIRSASWCLQMPARCTRHVNTHLRSEHKAITFFLWLTHSCTHMNFSLIHLTCPDSDDVLIQGANSVCTLFRFRLRRQFRVFYRGMKLDLNTLKQVKK